MFGLQALAGNGAVARLLHCEQGVVQRDLLRPVQRMNGAGSGAAGSRQGEHVFNALDDLANEMHEVIRADLARLPTSVSSSSSSSSGSPSPAEAADAALDRLGDVVRRLGAARNDANFATATTGDAANAARYGTFATAIRGAVLDILSGSPSLVTMGYTTLNRLYQGLEHSCVDTEARDSRKATLNPSKRGQFDEWFDATLELMYEVFAAIRDAALAVNAVKARGT